MVSPQAKDSILLVANYSPDVGFAWWLMENFWILFSQLAKSKGYDVLLLYPEPGKIPESIIQAEIETVIMPFPGSNFNQLSNSINLIKNRKVKIVYFTARPFTSLIYLRLRFAGVKLLIDHDHSPGDRPYVGGMKGLIKKLIQRIPLISCDAQLCVSDFIAKRAIDNIKIPSKKVFTVQNGIEALKKSELPDYTRKTLNLPKDKLICVSVGRAHKYKRIDFIIDVAEYYKFKLNRNDLIFVHCGDGPELENLKQLAETKKVSDIFIFAGNRSDIAKILTTSDFGFHAARGEAFSLSIIEYMSAGLAVIVPDIPSVSQAIRHNQTGMIYKDMDFVEAAKMLTNLVDNEDLRKNLGSAASIEVVNKYSLKQMNSRFLNVVEKLIDTNQ